MIIQSLVKRYEDTQIVPQGWQKRKVSYALDISESGELLEIIPLEWEETVKNGEKDKKVVHKREFVLPEPEVRASGIKAAFLCDDAGYLFGLDAKRGVAKFAASKDLHLRLLENTDNLPARAVKAWFNKGINPADVERVKAKIPEKALSQAVFVFQINGRISKENKDEDEKIYIKDKGLCTAWETHYFSAEEAAGEKILCLATGKYDAPERIHGKIKLRGGQSAGSNLISVNADSFASYGKTKDDRAADIGKYAAFAHVTALNDLLQNEKHRQFTGGDTLVYWAEDNSEPEIESLNFWLNPAAESDEETLIDIMEKAADAKYFDFENCTMDRPFYLLCLSPNAARISIRFFHASTFGNIINNLKEHYKNLEIIGDGKTKFTHLPYWLILNETTVTKESGKVAPLLFGQFLQSILKGTAYSQTLYNAMLMRIRAGEEINKIKAALIKAVLIKNYKEKEVTSVELNQTTDNKPYVLGRLFSVLEKLQICAAGNGLNATIRDRYFANACANPKTAFPTLLKLSVHHAAKLNNNTHYAEYVYYEKLKGELMLRLDAETPFPAAFGLEDQGKFILGYYHQRQSFFTNTKKEEDKN